MDWGWLQVIWIWLLVWGGRREDGATVVVSQGRVAAKKVLFVSMAYRGHAMPLLELTRFMKRRGYDVRFATQNEALPWLVDYGACEWGGDGEDCNVFVSLGDLVHGEDLIRKHLYSVLDDPSLLHGMWGVFRDLYLAQASQTAQALCEYLAPAFPNGKSVSCVLTAVAENYDVDRGEESVSYSSSSSDIHKNEERQMERMARQIASPWKPDIIVADIGAVGVLEIAELFRVPIVLNSPVLLFTLEDQLPKASRHHPGWGSGFPKSMTFFQRCINVVYPRMLGVALTPDFVMINSIRTEFGLPPYASQHDIFRNRRVMVNTVFGFEYPRYTHPMVEYVGPLLPEDIVLDFKIRHQGMAARSRSHSTMKDDDTMRWLTEQQKSGKPVIVCSLGSIGIVDWPLLEKLVVGLKHFAVLWVVSRDYKNVLIPGIFRLEYLFRYVREYGSTMEGDILHAYFRFCAEKEDQDEHVLSESELKICPLNRYTMGEDGPTNDQRDLNMDMLPSSFYIHERIQNLSLISIIAHDAVIATISYCGLAIAQESILAEKPLVCIPLFADQFDVAGRVADAGLGIFVDRATLFTQNLENIISYIARSRLAANLTKSLKSYAYLLAAAGGTASAVDIIESTLFAPPAQVSLSMQNWPWFQTSMFDVYLLLFSILTLQVSCIYFVINIIQSWRSKS